MVWLHQAIGLFNILVVAATLAVSIAWVGRRGKILFIAAMALSLLALVTSQAMQLLFQLQMLKPGSLIQAALSAQTMLCGITLHLFFLAYAILVRNPEPVPAAPGATDNEWETRPGRKPL